MRNYAQIILIWLFAYGNPCVSSASISTLQCTKSTGSICQIDAIPPHSREITLPDLSKRSTLRISKGILRNLTQTMVSKMASIHTLKLEDIGLTSVFVGPSFKKLYLRNNELIAIAPLDSGTTTYQLRELDMRQNMLTNISQLSSFVQMEVLNVDNNQLTELNMAVLKGMLNLRVFTASGNKIARILPTSSMLLLGELTMLSLASNNLSSIPMHDWELPVLRELHLNNNSLVTLQGVDNFERFYDLRQIALANNKWSCSWLQQALKDAVLSMSADGSSQQGISLDTSGEAECQPFNQFKGICCSFTETMTPDSDGQDVFQPEIDRLREGIKEIETQHQAFVRLRDEELRKLNETLQQRTNELIKDLSGQEDESKRLEARAVRVVEEQRQLQEMYTRMEIGTVKARDLLSERKRLLHFMVDMKNVLLRQAIDTDSELVQANIALIQLVATVEKQSSD